MKRFMYRTRIRAPAADAFRWHTREGAFRRLTPPWERVRVISRSGGIRDGAEVTLETRVGPLALRWMARHQDFIEGVQFRDVQVSGPFARWEHTHRFAPDGTDAFWMEDSIDYAPPLGALGQIVAGSAIAAKLARLFRYRHEVLAHDLAVPADFKALTKPFNSVLESRQAFRGCSFRRDDDCVFNFAGYMRPGSLPVSGVPDLMALPGSLRCVAAWSGGGDAPERNGIRRLSD
jgi:ligand-binding SRPBCC domain-containing protein